MPLTPLTSAAEVLVATGSDAFARGSLDRPTTRGWCSAGATAWIGTDSYERRPYLSALGEPGEVAALLAELLQELPPDQRVTLPRGTAARLPAWVGLDGTDWEFRWWDRPPQVQPGEEGLRPVHDEDAVAALLAEAHPTADAPPGDDRVVRWFGIPDTGGRLLACAADTSSVAGVGHLSSIAVHPGARGRGLGRAVTAGAVRRMADDGCEVVTLGVYAVNDAGTALYDALGAGRHRFTSGRLQVRSRW